MCEDNGGAEEWPPSDDIGSSGYEFDDSQIIFVHSPAQLAFDGGLRDQWITFLAKPRMTILEYSCADVSEDVIASALHIDGVRAFEVIWKNGMVQRSDLPSLKEGLRINAESINGRLNDVIRGHGLHIKYPESLTPLRDI